MCLKGVSCLFKPKRTKKPNKLRVPHKAKNRARKNKVKPKPLPLPGSMRKSTIKKETQQIKVVKAIVIKYLRKVIGFINITFSNDLAKSYFALNSQISLKSQ